MPTWCSEYISLFMFTNLKINFDFFSNLLKEIITEQTWKFNLLYTNKNFVIVYNWTHQFLYSCLFLTRQKIFLLAQNLTTCHIWYYVIYTVNTLRKILRARFQIKKNQNLIYVKGVLYSRIPKFTCFFLIVERKRVKIF